MRNIHFIQISLAHSIFILKPTNMCNFFLVSALTVDFVFELTKSSKHVYILLILGSVAMRVWYCGYSANSSNEAGFDLDV